MKELKDMIIPEIYEAGKIMLSAHDVENVEGNVKVKPGDANFVTVYDLKVQEFLIGRMKELFPNAEFFAEEKENSAEDVQKQYCFIIDPIDGTANFMHEYKRSSISVGLYSYGEAVFGAVYDPYLDEMFYAEKGKGAYLNGKRLHVSSRKIDVAIAAMGTVPYYKKELGGATFAIAKELYDMGADMRRAGSAAIDLSYVAAGRNDLFFELILSPWDYAAAQLIVKEAGGIVSDIYGNEVDVTKPCSVIAANREIYDILLGVTEKY
jgi:myo-inositol-1(or 4)-monophosphatase